MWNRVGHLLDARPLSRLPVSMALDQLFTVQWMVSARRLVRNARRQARLSAVPHLCGGVQDCEVVTDRPGVAFSLLRGLHHVD